MRNRALLMAAIAVVAIVIIGIVGTWIWIGQFLGSEQFRKMVSEKTGGAFHATAEFSPLDWTGSSVYSNTLRANGLPDSMLQTLEADQIRAEIDWRAIFDGAWRIDRLEVTRLEGTLKPGGPAATYSAAATPTVKPPGFLPRRFELGELTVAQTHLKFLGQSGSEIALLDGTRLRVEPDGAGWLIEGSGGTLGMPKLPRFDVSKFNARVNPQAVFLTDASLRLGTTGKIDASGEFTDNSRLRVEWSEVEVTPFLSPEWQTRLVGQVAGTALLEWPKAGLSAGKIMGDFHLSNGRLENLAVLEQIATFTGAPQFRHMPVQELSGKYTIENGKTLLTNIVTESKGLLRVEGDTTITADGSVNGMLRVGVTPQTLQWLPGSQERVFTVAHDGYLWTDVRITGTINDLREDLSSRLVGAVSQEAIQRGVDAIQNMPEKTRDTIKDAIDILSPLIR